eukprot:401890-Rhodomonas_salina.2
MPSAPSVWEAAGQAPARDRGVEVGGDQALGVPLGGDASDPVADQRGVGFEHKQPQLSRAHACGSSQALRVGLQVGVGGPARAVRRSPGETCGGADMVCG